MERTVILGPKTGANNDQIPQRLWLPRPSWLAANVPPEEALVTDPGPLVENSRHVPTQTCGTLPAILVHLPCPAREAPGPRASSVLRTELRHTDSPPPLLPGEERSEPSPVPVSPSVCHLKPAGGHPCESAQAAAAKPAARGCFCSCWRPELGPPHTWLLLVGFLAHVVSARGALAGGLRLTPPPGPSPLANRSTGRGTDHAMPSDAAPGFSEASRGPASGRLLPRGGAGRVARVTAGHQDAQADAAPAQPRTGGLSARGVRTARAGRAPSAEPLSRPSRRPRPLQLGGRHAHTCAVSRARTRMHPGTGTRAHAEPGRA